MAEVEHERLYWGARYEQDQDGVVWFTDENGQHYVLGQPVPVYGWEYMSRAEGMRIVDTTDAEAADALAERYMNAGRERLFSAKAARRKQSAGAAH